MDAETDTNQTEVLIELPLLPLKDIVIFPHMIVPVFISEDLCVNAVEESLKKHKKIFLSAFSVVGEQDVGLESSIEPPFDVYDVGTVCTIMRTRKLPDGRMKVLVQGLYKARLQKLLGTDGYPEVRVKKIEECEDSLGASNVEAMIRAVREHLEKVVSLGKVLSPDILMILEDIKDPGRLADLIAANLGLKVGDAQRVLSVSDSVARLEKVHTYLSREIEVYQMQVRIQTQAKEEIGKMQREHYLREQIRALKAELGDIDPKDEIEAFWEKVEHLPLSTEAREEVSRQLRRLEKMHQDTSEAALTRTHIETILGLPWENATKENLDIKKVVKDLDTDHFGLNQVKDRIIEYLAVKKLNPAAKCPILCFVGPPGVGKTSLGRAIANSIGRKFSRISLGGVRDEADIRGHRKTYVGAFPGRIIMSLKDSSSSNPLIMLDEIDKLGFDQRGDPASALLEVLDPEQNSQFVDHYLGIPFDLSQAMFIANANTLETIPAALRDRLEIIEVSGYSEEEKAEIAQRFLLPKQSKDNGLMDSSVQISKAAMNSIIRNYTRESGLRGLEKKLAAVCRKIARSIAENDDQTLKNSTIKLSPTKIEKFLGARVYGSQSLHFNPTVGVSLGLAYTQCGGEVLPIESNLLDGPRKLVLTGRLGDVMKESAQAALSFVRSRLVEFGIEASALDEKELHIHLPQGGVPKDGPSAGVALVTSILSVLLNKAPKAYSCMTGEITLHGKVLPIGGVKEKVLAAQREGLEAVILPDSNRSHFNDLAPECRKKIKVHFVDHYFDVFPLLFDAQVELVIGSETMDLNDSSCSSLAS